jgi:hypothetical protein
MERRPAVAALSALFCAISLAAAVLTQGCGGPTVELGPKPAVQSGFMPEAEYGESVDEMRAWLESLGSDDAKKLEETGSVTFPYQDLKASDRAHAEIVDRYVNKVEAGLGEAMRAQGMPAPQFAVQTVAFIRRAPGAYELELRWAPSGGTKVVLSDAL